MGVVKIGSSEKRAEEVSQDTLSARFFDLQQGNVVRRG